jgi:hypothetical protein
MIPDNSSAPKREPDAIWPVIHSGDNGIELLQCVIDVADFNEAARVGADIAAWITPDGREDPVIFTQITLRGWRVEINITVPVGQWSSLPQQKLVSTINDHFGSIARSQH